MLRPWHCLPAALGALLPGEAAACFPDPCADITAFAGVQRVGADLVEVDVPTDGVLLLEMQWFGELTQEELAAGLTLQVERDGEAVPGVVEPLLQPGLTGLLRWRPDELLAPSTTHTVRATLHNAEDVPPGCAASQIDLSFTFTTTAGPAEPLAPPQIWSDSSYSASPRTDLESLVCCDGAYPVATEICGVSQGLSWSAGKCVSWMNRARLSARLGVATILDEATAGQWARTLYQDGEAVATTLDYSFSRSLTEPACFRISQFSLATGESRTSEERCAGADLTQPLGDLPGDPDPMLAELCEGTPYICEVNDDGWVPERCQDWPLPADDPPPEALPPSGCNLRDARGPGLLALLLVLRRRRRR